MLNLLPINLFSPYIIDAIILLIRYGDIVFSETQNPVAVFLNGLYDDNARVIAAIKDFELIGVVVFFNFQYLSGDKFICYMYGAANRGFAKELELCFFNIFDSLKKQGCLAVRIETKKINLPMRFMARRLGFRKAGNFKCGYFSQGKIDEILIYEKML